ncbi:hypothetical protein CLAFUW4_01565 [Fulvia fulva]|uniref:Uncharacterized protein n=1 Tax=Passalora fulva TaxID=5499 RepID=A0A9Q8L5F8_PASFU|nr:uncharacterized protein CLAFUR5_01565 [Fulvia fulva]KAK4634709.1 hypothetical protein CLAFUR4_01564 [Fulvia fulva]KAK4638152.1 hypothetical protein CLAFUR0_01565 [Fulvia fulva]UJO11240.1 hypothetical protein CLAFUR5_01565 [Fulvia fulva]WPV09699.1 hypothetical protein CLAFUW4_01565 [Fulvia fulva]WPV23713.1 hypothetical protein CLAFUW7_01568 [Fulvia fulva]
MLQWQTGAAGRESQNKRKKARLEVNSSFALRFASLFAVPPTLNDDPGQAISTIWQPYHDTFSPHGSAGAQA